MRLGAGLCAAALAGLASAAMAVGVTEARYLEPTDRYGHAILGDAIEWGALEMQTADGPVLIRLPETHVFEDTAPRLADLDGDGDFEVIVVETAIAEGARLSVYDETGLVAATPHIGRTHRWLAPVGAVDLDGDGAVEIAYVDRPHRCASGGSTAGRSPRSRRPPASPTTASARRTLPAGSGIARSARR